MNIEVKIYVLRDPITNEIRYIGRTKNFLNRRLNGHLSKAKTNKFKTHKDNWLLSLLSRPIIEELITIIGWTESHIYEQNLIKEYLKNGYNLVNLDDRGEGSVNKIISEEQKLKISKKVKELHDNNKLSCNRKSVDIYDLNGVFIISKRSYKEASEFIGISQKQFQISMKRKAKRIKQYQIVLQNSEKPNKWKQRTGEITKNFKKIFLYNVHTNEIIEFEAIKRFKEFFNTGASTVNYYLNNNRLYKNKFLITDARLKLDEFRETPEVDNPELSL